MLKATSRLETERASSYLQAMCKHFRHKVPVNYDATAGTADMPHGLLNMHVEDDTLHFHVQAADDQSLARMKYVVEAHIVRFAFREKLKKLEWD